MFSRSICCASLTKISQGPLNLLLQKPVGNGHILLRSSFHNSRRNVRRPLLEGDPLSGIQIETGPLYTKNLVKPLLFAIGVSAASVVGCAVWEYEKVRSHATSLFRRPSSWLKAQEKKIITQFKTEPGSFTKWWSSLRETEKVFFPILAANLLVFASWRVKALQPIMVRYFCSNPSSSAICLPMVLSTFSHYSFLHLAANMYVLHSFMPAAVASLGKEQFVGMYMSAGVVSSFASFLYKVVANQPGLSLGASGAIMAVLSYVCVQYPDTRLSIIFLPMYSFAASSAIKVIMSADLAGVAMGWKIFDHAAHLGGALFGIAWCHWGTTHLWGNRDKFLQYYHSVRKTER